MSSDKVCHGRVPLGSRHGNAKLTEEKVKLARHLVASGHKLKDVAALIGCSKSNIHFIVKGTTWAHV